MAQLTTELLTLGKNNMVFVSHTLHGRIKRRITAVMLAICMVLTMSLPITTASVYNNNSDETVVRR